MTRKLISIPFINIRSPGEGSVPPLSDPGNMVISIDNENKRIVTSKDGGEFQPLDQEVRNGIVINEEGILQGIGTTGIKVNNERVFGDNRFTSLVAGLQNLESSVFQTENIIQLKPDKIFFKYNGDNQPIADQSIEITIIKGSSVTASPAISISPGDKNIQLVQSGINKYTLTVEEFDKANLDTIQITITLVSNSTTLTDSLTIYKARDGMNSLVGGLTNPFVAIQLDGSGNVPGGIEDVLASSGGTFTVLKGTDDLTGNGSRIAYSIESVPEAFLNSSNSPMVFINSSGEYSFSGFNIDELIGEVTFVATDLLTNQQIKSKFTMLVVKQGEAGQPGASGVSARTVKLTANDSQISYRSDDKLLDPTSITLQAQQQNHQGDVYYEFVVYEGLSSTEILLRNTTASSLNLTNTSVNYGSGQAYTFISQDRTAFGKSKTVKVRTREGSPTGTIKAEDAITIISTKDGSDALEIVFENSNHSFVATQIGSSSDYSVTDYTGGGSIVEAYIGNEQLNAKQSGTPGNGEFVVSVSAQTDIVSGLPSIVVGNQKRIVIGDPSGMANNKDTASVTYSIVGKSSAGVEKIQSIKASFSKSKQGMTGSSGVGARSVELVASAYQFNYNNNNQSSPSSFTLTATARGTTSTNIKYKFYKNGILLTNPSQPQSSNTIESANLSLPAANASAAYSVELLEDDVVKATDSISVYGTKDGSDGVTLIVPNDSHTVTADKDGVPTTLAGSGTTIKLLIGSQPLTATVNATPASGQFRAFIATNGSISFPGTPISVSDTNTLLLADATAFGSDSGTVTLSVEFVRPGSSTKETITRNLSYSKSKKGEDGPQGPQGQRGSDGIDISNKIWDFTQKYDDGGVSRPYGWNDSAQAPSSSSLIPSNLTITKMYPSFFTTISSSDSVYGGNLATITCSDLTSGNYIYLYSAEAVSVGQNDTFELNYQLTISHYSTSVKVGLFFYNSSDQIITSTNSSITAYPHVIGDHSTNSSQNNSTFPGLYYYSFETGGSLKTFPTGTKKVRPYILVRSTAATTGQVCNICKIDKLFFGVKTTPNKRSGIFIDNLTGRITMGESNVNLAGTSGDTVTKFDSTANLEIIEKADVTSVADIRITQTHPTYVYNKLQRGADFAAIRFAGWNGVYSGATTSTSLLVDERAEIRASYCIPGAQNSSTAAMGGAALDFYTAAARSSIGLNSTASTNPALRMRINDVGQVLVGYDDIDSVINVSGGTGLNPDTGGTFNGGVYTPAYLYSNNYRPTVAVNGGILAKNILIDSNNPISVFGSGLHINKIMPYLPDSTGATVEGTLGTSTIYWPTAYVKEITVNKINVNDGPDSNYGIYGTFWGDTRGTINTASAAAVGPPTLVGHAVQAGRYIYADFGLTGGGNLLDHVYLAVDKTKIATLGDTQTFNSSKTFSAGHNITLTNGNLILGTAGKGIDFSATNAGSGTSGVGEILDDYEQGTFTPTLTTTGGTVGTVTYGSYRHGKYVKVGNVVNIQIAISASSWTGSSGGSVRITGLPFACESSSSDVDNNTPLAISHVNIGTTEEVFANIKNGQSYIDFSRPSGILYPAACTIYLSGVYFTSA